MRFGSDYSDKLVEQEDLVGFDLCVLATSQHTVITYGTFGLWGALLAGGEVLAAKGRNNITLTEVTSAFSAPWSQIIKNTKCLTDYFLLVLLLDFLTFSYLSCEKQISKFI